MMTQICEPTHLSMSSAAVSDWPDPPQRHAFTEWKEVFERHDDAIVFGVGYVFV
jgi:hypothetical protein